VTPHPRTLLCPALPCPALPRPSLPCPRLFLKSKNVAVDEASAAQRIAANASTYSLFWRYLARTGRYLNDYQDSSVVVVHKPSHNRTLQVRTCSCTRVLMVDVLRRPCPLVAPPATQCACVPLCRAGTLTLCFSAGAP